MVRKGQSSPIKLTRAFVLAFFIGCGLGFALYPMLTEPGASSTTEQAPVRACFSPEGQCTRHISSAIKGALSSIFVQAYSFTSPQIAQALIDAHERGVDVKILIDKSQRRSKGSQLSFLYKKGIPILIDSPAGLAHNKVMIIDQRYVLTGSFNFTKAAESRNAENVLLLDNPSLAHIYTENWQKRARKARPLAKS